MFFAPFHKKRRWLLAAFLLLLPVATARAAGPEADQPLAIFTDGETTPLPSPATRPVSKIAENVTVITADDISRLNAHTLAEVLQTVPGIQLDYLRSPTTFAFFNVQGMLNTDILVMIDGIRQNDFDQDIVSPGIIPVQQIERIEIVKGAASGSWGSALGGVINIVTKSPDPDRALAGTLSASTGSRFTADSRIEAAGSAGRFGYYLTAGHLRSSGLSPNTAAALENLYGKGVYTLPGEGTVTLGLSLVADWQGEDDGFVPVRGFIRHENGSNRHRYGFLRLDQPLGGQLSLQVQGYATDREDDLWRGKRDPLAGVVFTNQFSVQDATRGGKADLVWGDRRNNLTVGGEYGHVHALEDDLMTPAPPFYERTWDSYALHASGTLSLGRVSVLPGARLDATGPWGDRTSSSLGLAYELAEQTTLRAYAAQGFSLPKLASNTGVQRVKTVQGGFETDAIPFLWFKGTYFFNALRDNSSVGPSAETIDQDIHGYELESRTRPLYGFSISGGYTYLYAVDLTHDQRLQTSAQQTVPTQTYKVALRYDQADAGVRGILTGTGVVWNGAPGFPTASRGMVWDLHLDWKPFPASPLSPELFISAHNLTDTLQTVYTPLYPNAPRWFEGGARLNF
ncbi:ligand-gated TonB-dependent outer membrane channel [Geomonas sp. Red276]